MLQVRILTINIVPAEDDEAPPALVEELSEGHTHESIDREHARYISNMVSRWAGSDYESSEDEYAHCSRGH